MEAYSVIFSAIKENFGFEFDPKDIPEQEANEILCLAEGLDMSHLVALPQFKDYCEKKKLAAFYRTQLHGIEEEQITKLLDENKINYVLLKGSVIRHYYPEKWMRTSSDIDILVKDCDIERASEVICNSLGYSLEEKGSKDYQLYNERGTHLELHFSIKSDDVQDTVLGRVWDFVTPNENSFGLSLTPEFLLFYIIAHARFHFVAGGCGIKPFLDFWVMKNKLNYDKDKLFSLIKESKNEEFFEFFNLLTAVWFENSPHTELSLRAEKYILCGGAYGTSENLGAASAHREGGWFRYFIKRVFKPKSELEIQYPNLKKRPLLLPFYQIKRWFNLFNKDRRSDVNAEISGGLKKDETEKLFKELGL